MDIVMLPLNTLRPYWRNPRNNDKAIQQVMKSIQDYGFNQPIVIDKEHVIIVGHSRYKALLNLGWESAPCIISDMEPSKAKEYRVIDNKTSELADWNFDNLITELREFDKLPEFQDYFPDFDLAEFVGESVGEKQKDTTQVTIDNTKRKLGTVFEERQKAEISDYIEVTCPECGETFAVSRDDLLKRLH